MTEPGCVYPGKPEQLEPFSVLVIVAPRWSGLVGGLAKAMLLFRVLTRRINNECRALLTWIHVALT